MPGKAVPWVSPPSWRLVLGSGHWEARCHVAGRGGRSPGVGARWRRSRTPRGERRHSRCSPTSTRPPWLWATGVRAGRATPPNSSSSSAAARSAAPSPWPRGCATACASCAPSACGTQVPPGTPPPRLEPHHPTGPSRPTRPLLPPRRGPFRRPQKPSLPRASPSAHSPQPMRASVAHRRAVPGLSAATRH